MKRERTICFTRLFALASTIACGFASPSSFSQGALTPPGGPSPTMKTLDQIEARTPISSVPFTIANPGSYYLTSNLTVSNSNAIAVAASGVTLDLNGFTIFSMAPSPTNTAISLNSGLRNISIANGFIQGGVTNNGSGVYDGNGFFHGIYYSGDAPVNVLVSRISVSGCLQSGIFLGNGDLAVVESCAVRTVGDYGIAASVIKTCLAVDCGRPISGGQVSDCRGQGSGSGDGVYAMTAQNCYGSSKSGTGLVALTAQNCFGSSEGSGQGVRADTAINCYGISQSNRGVFVTIGIGCIGYCSGTSYGVFASRIANNCYGFSASGLGLNSEIAIGCAGNSVFSTYHYNMPP